MPISSKVELTIYNSMGQRVRTLVNTRQPAGFYQVEWDGRDELGREVANGIYIYQIKMKNFSQSRKMLYLK
ncbi:MAG: T9SS type A sorting domain-containing protein [Calditrichae bacterium]|nr:T9SS type A sorting domain-containing protein [Calditrichia bacterium]